MSEERKNIDVWGARVGALDLAVRDMMQTNVVSLKADKPLLEVAEMMSRHRIRHLPIVNDEGQLSGLVTHRDLVRYCIASKDGAPQSIEVSPTISIRDIMRDDRVSEVVTVSSDLSLRTAALKMVENKIGCLPVVDKKNRIIGILTESDFVEFFANGI